MKVSVIIRAYNAQETIGQAVESAINQNFPKEEFEILVINDGSTDNTGEILKRFGNYSILRIFNQKNKGPIVSANVGFKRSRGTYVILLDSDDIFKMDLLKEFSGVLDNKPNIDFVYCDYYEQLDNKRRLISPKNIFETVASGVMFRKTRLTKEGFYREGLFFAEYDLLLRTLGRWRGYHLHKPLYTYWRRTKGLTGNEKMVKENLLHLEQLHPDKLGEIRKIRSYTIS